MPESMSLMILVVLFLGLTLLALTFGVDSRGLDTREPPRRWL